jgi:transcriptional regulator with XRE-family HTH domain
LPFLPGVRVILKGLKVKILLPEPQTIGEHIRRSRIQKGISQPEAARVLGVSPETVLNWEKAYRTPSIEAVPAVLRFLGYDPFPRPSSLSDRMRAKRRRNGWSIKEAARAFGVDEGTWGHWERTGKIPWRRYLRKVDAFLADD